MTLADALRAEFGERFEDLVDVLPKHASARYGQRSLDDVQYVVVHHTAARREVSWEAVARYHVGSEGWPGVAYHIGLRLDGGAVIVSLLNQPETRSYHAHAAGNSHGLAVVVAGDFRLSEPAAEEIDALWRVVRVVRSFLGRDLPVCGHRDVPGNDTTCPGERLYDQVAKLARADTLDGLIWQVAKAHQAIRPNPGSAIEQAMRAQGFAPIGNEADVHLGGVWQGMAQLGYDVATGAEAAFFATNLTEDGQWAVRRLETPGQD